MPKMDPGLFHEHLLIITHISTLIRWLHCMPSRSSELSSCNEIYFNE